MKVELERLKCPEFAEELPCSLCERRFMLGVVIARAVSEHGMDYGEVCPECALHLADGPMGSQRPASFPDLQDFAEALREWQQPEFPSEAELYRATGI